MHGVQRPAPCRGLRRRSLARTRKVAALTAAVGGRHLVFVPVPGYRDDATGAYLEPAELDPGGLGGLWSAPRSELGRIVADDYGLRLQFHPHADSHVETQEQTERFLADTDPRYVNLCLDTGHLGVPAGGQRRDHQPVPGPDRLRPPQAGGP